MPKYYFRARMCMTFIIECERNTLISDIKILFGQELKISTSDITMWLMGKRKLKDNEQIGSFPPFERSFIFVKFNSDFFLPDLSHNKMIKLVNSEMHGQSYDFPFEYVANPTPKQYNLNEFTIFSDNYQLHSQSKAMFNHTTDHLLEGMYYMIEENYNTRVDQTSTDFFPNLIEKYKNNDPDEFKKSLMLIKDCINSEIQNSPFQVDSFDYPANILSGFKQKFGKDLSFYNKIVEKVNENSPEAAKILSEIITNNT